MDSPNRRIVNHPTVANSTNQSIVIVRVENVNLNPSWN